MIQTLLFLAFLGGDTPARRASEGGVWPAFAAASPSLALRANVSVVSAAGQPNDEAVESGREVLRRGWISPNHPWYDRETDDVKLVPLPEPEPTSSDPSWSFRLWEWLSRMKWLAWTVIALLLLLLVLYLAKVYAGKERSPAAAEHDDDEGGRIDRVEALPQRVKRHADNLLGEARRHYEQGDYSAAMVFLFSYLLLELDKQQFIRLAKGKTNRQYLSELRRHPELLRLVEGAMEMFEEVFFGNHPLARGRFEQCWSRLEKFHQLLRREES